MLRSCAGAHTFDKCLSDIQPRQVRGLRGIKFKVGAKVAKVTKSAKGVAVAVEIGGKAETLEAEVCISAVGITANTDGIGLEALGVELDRGHIKTDSHCQTNVKGLYAIGETSFTGLHGANRMASNSLLECFVYARSACADITEQLNTIEMPSDLPDWDASQVTDSDEDVIIAHNWDELRRFMWDYVGIVRTNKRLQRAQHRVRLLLDEIDEFYSNYKVSRDLIELRNLALVAELMIRSAMQRHESRGLHYTLDYPEQLAQARDTILVPTPPAQPSVAC